MSDPENFAARWSRLKRENLRSPREAERAQPEPPAGRPDKRHVANEQTENPVDGEATEASFDLASLPPIESITSATDIRAFLQSGVPADLTSAALRRAWTTDPAIRDFIGLAENQWDFTDPASIPGFGPLEAGENVGTLVSQAMGKLELGEAGDVGASARAEESSSAVTGTTPPDGQIVSQPAGMPEENDRSWCRAESEECEHTTSAVASQHVSAAAETEPAPNRRAHGGALPK